MRCKDRCHNPLKAKRNFQNVCSSHGAVYAEFAIIFPLLFFLFLTFIDFGRLYYYRGLASASAQRGVSLAQVIAGMEEVDTTDPSDPVMLAIKSRAEDFIHNSVGVPITSATSEMVSILPATLAVPLIVLPEVNTMAGETLEDQMQSEPIEIQFQLRMRPFSPWLKTMNVMVHAAGFRELALQSSVPVPVDCSGVLQDEFGAVAPADCRCPGAPDDGTVWDAVSNTCICAVTEGGCAGECPDGRVWNPSIGDAGGCECTPCADSENQNQNSEDCTCGCTSTGDIDVVFNDGEGLCVCPYELEITDARSCVCPETRLEQCITEDKRLGFNPAGTSLEEVCPCLDCPNPENQTVVDNVCVCAPVEDIDACPEGSVITNEGDCTCECPGNLTNEADPETCECPVDSLCANDQSVDVDNCVCEDCDPGQLQNPSDPESCECPSAPGDITQVCTGAGEVFDPGAFSCSCTTCPDETPNANAANTACVCLILENAGGNPADACPADGQVFDADNCRCVPCTGATPDESADNLSCLCEELTPGVGDDCTDTQRVNPSNCTCQNCTNLRVQNPGDITAACVCPSYSDIVDDGLGCAATHRFNPTECKCISCGGNREQDETDPTKCVCKPYEEQSFSCGGTQYYDAANCNCVGCPQGQIQDPDNPEVCRCPEAGDDLTQVCTGASQIYNGSCGCSPCVGATPNANSENTACVCLILENAGGNPADACPIDGQVFDPATCSCVPCTGLTPDEAGDGVNCTCDLTAGGTITDPTELCTGSDEIYQGGCNCVDCTGSTPDANPGNDACVCLLLENAGGDANLACPNSNEIFNPATCSCIPCVGTANPDASADGLNCVCAALEDAGGDTTALCTDPDQFFDAANCNVCGTCEGDFASNGNNTACECELNAEVCALSNSVFEEPCTCTACPEGQVVENGACVCEEACDASDPTGSVTDPNSCVCVCPVGTTEGDFHGQNRCWNEGCWVDGEFDCDGDGNNNDDGNQGE